MNSSEFQFGRDILGPIIEDYLERLDQAISFFSFARRAKILFVARAGIRIQKLYEIYLDKRGRSQTQNFETMYISRILLVKGLWGRSPKLFFDIINREFRDQDIGTIVAALLSRRRSILEACKLTPKEASMPATAFQMWMDDSGDAAKILKECLREEATLIDTYIASLTQGAETVLLVDSGWHGTSQKILIEGWGNLTEWWGAYFGKVVSPDRDHAISQRMLGLGFDANRFKPFLPLSSITQHRHLIEHLFEPTGESVERLIEFNGLIYGDTAGDLETEDLSAPRAAMYLGVRDYITSLNLVYSRAEVRKRANSSACKLAGMILFPTRDEAVILGSYCRSADFGRKLNIPVLFFDNNDRTSDSEKRIKAALWKAGQIPLELPRELAEIRQQHELGLQLDRKKIEFLGTPLAKTASLVDIYSGKSVSVIMRTRDRPIFLRRALDSVANQTYQNYNLIVVCDGGDVDLVIREVRNSSLDPRKVKVVNTIVNRGMEASSNIGIGVSHSEYIVIHDDDDSWHSTFLEKCIRFLDSEQRYGGVITHTWRISEEVLGDSILIKDKSPFNDWVNNVQIMEMSCENFFPPISFVFRRSICVAINGFDEDLPVLGDWDFNLRFLEKTDIGVLREKLANYHHRDSPGAGLFSNSIFGQRSKHIEFNALLRNKYARNQKGGVSNLLVNLGHSLNSIRNEVRSLGSIVSAQGRGRPAQFDAESYFSEQADTRWVQLHDLCGKLSSSTASSEDDDPFLLGFDTQIDIHSVNWTMISPPPDFNEERYIFENDDVPALIRQGIVSSGFEHFMRWGRTEGRVRPFRFCRDVSGK